jgi:transcriptional regulator
VHSFYLNNGAGFTDISARTGGKASKFDLHSPNVTKNLTQFVVENILELIEKNSGKGDLKLVETYRKMFMK